jgi:hippurate hydrolase
MTSAFDDELVTLRRRLHQVPEVGLDLPRTQAIVLEALTGLDLEISTGDALSSVVAVLRGRATDAGDRVVLLRGDMDALPVVEASGEPFAATGETMHACGHDLHTAGLAGAARLLSERRSELRGDVVFMFQPGEEGSDGAGAMIAEGVLDAAGRRADAAYGLHVFANMLPLGHITTRPGPLMAASSGLYVTVRGAGGHGSRPHAAADPIVVAAEMVTALQTMVTRQFDVFDPVVVTVGSFHAGTRPNIIPETATFEATVRTLSVAHLATVEKSSVQLCEQIAEAHGCSAEVRFEPGYPLTVNDPDKTAFALSVAAELVGGERVQPLENPVMGAEDFSRVLAEVPGCYLFVGACPSDPETAPGNHAPGARFDDVVLGDCARLLAELAVRELAR